MKKQILLIAMIQLSVAAFSDQTIKENSMKQMPENLKSLLELSLRAPSSHNAQMWRITYTGPETIEIDLDKERLLPEVDPEHREAYISIGALIENITSAAPEYSLSAHIEEGGETGIPAVITFKSIEKTENTHISDLIRKRCTIRSNISSDPLKGIDIKDLFSLSPESIKHFSSGSIEGSIIREKTIQAAALQTDDDNKQEELSKWMRFSKHGRNTEKDGITPEMMGFKGIMKEFIYLIFNEKTAMKKSFRKKTIPTFKKQLENCSGFFIITSENNSAESLIETGRLLQRFWLKCAEKNIAVHPMNQAVQEKLILNESDISGNIERSIQLILRTGYVDKYPKPSSRRVSIDDILEYR